MSGRIQITVIRIDNYGPWTETLGEDREHTLQILQSELYAHLVGEFAGLGGVVFYNKHDEMVAVTNGISLAQHAEIQRGVARLFPVTVSMGVGVGLTPYEAQLRASVNLNRAAGPRSPDLKSVLAGDEPVGLGDGEVKVVHFDVDGFTEKWTATRTVYDSSLVVRRLYSELTELLLGSGSLVFYCGGDNYISLANGLDEHVIESLFGGLEAKFDLTLKAGVGVARTGRRAVELATTGLDMIRRRQVDSKVHVLREDGLRG